MKRLLTVKDLVNIVKLTKPSIHLLRAQKVINTTVIGQYDWTEAVLLLIRKEIGAITGKPSNHLHFEIKKNLNKKSAYPLLDKAPNGKLLTNVDKKHKQWIIFEFKEGSITSCDISTKRNYINKEHVTLYIDLVWINKKILKYWSGNQIN